jgi:hypothetical protein
MEVEVQFDKPQGDASYKYNLGLHGTYRVEAGGDSLLISGRRRLLLLCRHEPTLEVAFDEILNVERSGDHLRFELYPSNPKLGPQIFSFRCTSEEEATAMEVLLPKTHTEDFERAKDHRRGLESEVRQWRMVPVIVAFVLPFIGLVETFLWLYLRPPQIRQKALAGIPDWFGFYFGVLLCEWPFFALAGVATRQLRSCGQDTVQVSWSCFGALVGLIIPYGLLCCAAMPGELTSGATDAGQGIGLGLIFGSPLFALMGVMGWCAGSWLAKRFGKGRTAMGQSPPASEQSRQDSSLPVIWNPTAAALLSIPFTSAFGSFLHSQNAERMGRTEEARRNRIWFYASLALVGLDLLPFTRDFIPTWVYAGLLLAWWFTTGKKQCDYIQGFLGDRYFRDSWRKPLLIACALLVVLLVIYHLTGQGR